MSALSISRAFLPVQGHLYGAHPRWALLHAQQHPGEPIQPPEPGEPNLPGEPGEPTLPDQPPPAPVA